MILDPFPLFVREFVTSSHEGRPCLKSCPSADSPHEGECP
jgi:hypothetical protein